MVSTKHTNIEQLSHSQSHERIGHQSYKAKNCQPTMVNVDDDKERRFLLSNIFSNDDGNCNGYWTTTPTTTIDHNRQFSGDGDLNSIKTTNGNEVVVVVEQKDNHDKRRRASNIDWRTPMDQFDCHSNECNQFGTLVHTFGNYRNPNNSYQ
ncbi:hypothetical protein BLOT_016711 [Blomia tropicalis]|nr:hypothetical protein BLOT_016711 [Blomia tropicalis]